MLRLCWGFYNLASCIDLNLRFCTGPGWTIFKAWRISWCLTCACVMGRGSFIKHLVCFWHETYTNNFRAQLYGLGMVYKKQILVLVYFVLLDIFWPLSIWPQCVCHIYMFEYIRKFCLFKVYSRRRSQVQRYKDLGKNRTL